MIITTSSIGNRFIGMIRGHISNNLFDAHHMIDIDVRPWRLVINILNTPTRKQIKTIQITSRRQVYKDTIKK